jgi:hypothetical protein
MLVSGLAYGVGLLLGTTVSILIANAIEFSLRRREASDFGVFLLGLLLAYLIYGLGGAIGGFCGGLTLPVAGKPRGRWGYAWQSAGGLALLWGGFLFTTILVISVFSFYNVVEVPPDRFILQHLWVGVAFGVLFGLLLALVTVGWRQIPRVVLAAAIGFGLGGIALGIGLRLFLVSVLQGDLFTGQFLFLVVGVLLFGLAGGGALGLIYGRIATRLSSERPAARMPSFGWLAYAAIGVILVLFLVWLQPTFALIRTILTPRSANLASILAADAVGTHWFDPVTIKTVAGVDGTSVQTAVSAAGDRLALVWAQPSAGGSTILYRSGSWDADNQQTVWTAPVTVYGGSGPAVAPQVVLAGDGTAHVVWLAGSEIGYNRCLAPTCDEPVDLSDTTGLTCGGAVSSDLVALDAPTLALGSDDTLMVAWPTKAGRLLYRTWPGSASLPTGSAGCVPTGDAYAAEPRLAANPNGEFDLIYRRGREIEGGEINSLAFKAGDWEAPPLRLGSGYSPEILAGRNGQPPHFAWCGGTGGIAYRNAENTESVSDLPCLSRPELVQDSNDRVHLIWYANEVTNAAGVPAPFAVIYESIQTEGGWSAPAVVARPGAKVQPAAANVAAGELHLTWPEIGPESTAVRYAAQIQYECLEQPPQRQAQIVLQIARQARYRPAGDIIPYCGNRYDRMILTPNPVPAFSEQSSTPNGGYDGLAELIKTAEYEVLFTTMDYDEAENQDSPGAVLAEAVAALYWSLRQNPERYPRGLTVRILLGNPPRLLAPNSELWLILDDLRNAGVPVMVDDELGWRLEVANFDGAWPHSHVKMVVVDGKTVAAVGFNMQYTHFPAEHASGLGHGTVDTALQVTGPVAQDARRAFDELWTGSVLRHCNNFSPFYRLWRLTCRDSQAASSHVPEARRYYLPRGTTTAFSMLRTSTHDEADQQVVTALAAAEESIDIMHVMFSLPLGCNLEYLFKVCTVEQAPVYMQSILDAVEANNVRARLLIDLKPVKGIESFVALQALQEAVDTRGLSDRVEIRSFPGPVHAKNTLIDGELLIVGSQNYHWSAFGPGQGLAEYSLGVSDPQAIEEFERRFQYYWDLADHPAAGRAIEN